MSSWIEMAGSENTPGLAKIRQIKNIFKACFPPHMGILDGVPEQSSFLSPQKKHIFSIHKDEERVVSRAEWQW